MAAEARGSGTEVVVAQPLLVIAEPLVAARARGPLVVLAGAAGQLVAAEGRPVAVAHAPPERNGEARQHRPGDGGQPQRGGDIDSGPERRDERGNAERTEHDETRAPGGARRMGRMALRVGAGHGGGLREAGGVGAPAPDSPVRVRPAPLAARLRLVAAPLPDRAALAHGRATRTAPGRFFS